MATGLHKYKEDEDAARRLDELETVCSELYQVLGTLGAPGYVLDQALAAAEGRDLPRDTILPFSLKSADRMKAAAVLGLHGGLQTTLRKIAAAQRNGTLGGRPKKVFAAAARPDRVVSKKAARKR